MLSTGSLAGDANASSEQVNSDRRSYDANWRKKIIDTNTQLTIGNRSSGGRDHFPRMDLAGARERDGDDWH